MKLYSPNPPTTRLACERNLRSSLFLHLDPPTLLFLIFCLYYPHLFMLFFWDHDVCPAQPPFPDAHRTRSVCTARVRILFALLFPKIEDEINPKKQSPTAPSAQSDCFLDSSCVWLPQPGDTAHSSPGEPPRGRLWPWRTKPFNCTHCNCLFDGDPNLIEAWKTRRRV